MRFMVIACLVLCMSATCWAEVPLAPRRVTLPRIVDGRSHPIDRIADAYFQRNDVERPGRVSDSVFLRRVYLDVIGLLPDPQQRRTFLQESRPNKRQRLVRVLLADDISYAEHWLTFWNDLLRNDYTGTGFITKGRTQITGWLYTSLVDNKPYDQFVRELLVPTAESEGFIRGIRWRGNVSASQRQEVQFAQNVSQAFLGINMKCASCHDSFIDRWTLEETYGLAAIYSTEPLALHRCDKPIDKVAKAAWMFPELGEIDATAAQPERMQQLAALMTHPENGRFTRTIVNRIWHQLMGRGIVHPVDAMHTAPWDEDLLDYLAVHLADNDYDVKKTIDLIATSEIYQARTPANAQRDEAGEYVFRGPATRRMTAEQFVDAVWQVTGAAPSQPDAQVVREKQADRKDRSSPKLTANWIWSTATASAAAPAGETVVLRREFEITDLPENSIAIISCDNAYALLINGREVASDDNWETVEVVQLQPHLKRGKNTFLVTAKNGGDSPNPAGFLFQAILRDAAGDHRVIESDETWKVNKQGRYTTASKDWIPAVPVNNQNVWASKVAAAAHLLAAVDRPFMMVRASLVKSDYLMRALGRPNRDQIVTSRPNELTTLEAIDLANGQTLADAIEVGASRRIQGSKKSAAELTEWLFQFALSRPPTAEELRLGEELLGVEPHDQTLQDLMWAVLMLPEFQLVR